jgi:hypothetical protein
MISLPEAPSRLRHTGRIHLNGMRESVPPLPVSPSSSAMAELARQIIRQQWPLRNHPDTLRRAQARSLIRAHVMLLRKWSGIAPMPR